MQILLKLILVSKAPKFGEKFRLKQMNRWQNKMIKKCKFSYFWKSTSVSWDQETNKLKPSQIANRKFNFFWNI